MTPVSIYHNPACATSRNSLALLQASGVKPTVIEYLQAPPDRRTLRALISAMRLPVRAVLRIKGTPHDTLGLGDASLTDEQLLDAMQAHPILINRPIVVSPRGVQLCRPSDLVADLFPEWLADRACRPPTVEVCKEDGTPFLLDHRIDGADPALAAALGQGRLPAPDPGAASSRYFRFSTVAGQPVGHAGFERSGADVLIRSLVIEPSRRGSGLAGSLLAILLRRAFDDGARQAWLLTTTATSLFVRYRFDPVPRAEAPAALLASRQFQLDCPTEATLLRRSLSL